MLKRLIEILNEKELDANSFFFLYSKLNNIPTDTHGDFDPEFMMNGEVTKEGIEFVKYTVKEIKKEITSNKRKVDAELKSSIKEWINEYRALFKGIKSGIMGDPKACLEKMVRFHEEYPELADKDKIFKATEAYIQSEANHNYKYLQRADYFIYKVTGKEEISRLASYCEEDSEVEQSFTKQL